MKEHELYLIMSSPTEIRNKNIEVIEKVLSEDYTILVITTNQPYDILKKNYEKNGILLDRIYLLTQ